MTSRAALKLTGVALVAVWLTALPAVAPGQFLRNLRQQAREKPQPQTTATLSAQPTRRQGARPATPATSGQNRQIQAALATEPIPRDALSRYAGRWKGNFWVYAPTGRLLERKTVQVDCALTQDGRMTMTTHMFDLVGRKLVVIESSTYQITGRDTIKVSIQRPTGKIETQNGRWNDDALFLTSVRSDGIEHMRERITEGKLLVDGYGIYGGARDLNKQSVFVGRLKKER